MAFKEIQWIDERNRSMLQDNAFNGPYFFLILTPSTPQLLAIKSSTHHLSLCTKLHKTESLLCELSW
jgi:hypothetical protein